MQARTHPGEGVSGSRCNDGRQIHTWSRDGCCVDAERVEHKLAEWQHRRVTWRRGAGSAAGLPNLQAVVCVGARQHDGHRVERRLHKREQVRVQQLQLGAGAGDGLRGRQRAGARRPSPNGRSNMRRRTHKTQSAASRQLCAEWASVTGVGIGVVAGGWRLVGQWSWRDRWSSCRAAVAAYDWCLQRDRKEGPFNRHTRLGRVDVHPALSRCPLCLADTHPGPSTPTQPSSRILSPESPASVYTLRRTPLVPTGPAFPTGPSCARTCVCTLY
eukprot:353874-Chlamydomonas_euryale.AAC.3